MSTIHELLLVLHSFTRWWVLLVCLSLVPYALSGWLRRRAFVARDEKLLRLLVASVDLQVLLGLSLYFAFSPLARAARALWATRGFGAFWADPLLRFFGLVHPVLALTAALVVHASWVSARRAHSDVARYRRVAAGAALGLVLFLTAVPWPFLGHERPWFRF
jgi:hypothetical protein